MDKLPSSGRNIGEILASLEDLSKKISPIEIPKEPGLKTTLLNLFTHCCSINQSMSEDDAWNEHLSIRKVLDDEYLSKSNKIETYINSSPRMNNVDSFMSWVKDNGVDCTKLGIFKKENNEFGMRTIQSASKGDILLKINRELMLAADDIKTDSLLENFVVSDPLINSMPNVCLSFGLISHCYRAMENNDKWSKYISLLPSNYANVCYFAKEDFECLKNTSVFIESLALWKSIVRQYAYIHLRLLAYNSNDEKISNHLKNICENFSLSDYRWAAATVMTRANPIPSKDSQMGTTLALIPFLDMCNHSTTIQSIMFNSADNSCELISPINVETDKEFFIFYGARPTSHYVLHNGFFIQDSPHDFTFVPMIIDKSDPLEKEKLDILKKVGLNIMKGYPVSKQIPPWFGDVVTFLRVKVCNKQEIDNLLTLDNETLKKKLFINNKNVKKSILNDTEDNRISTDNEMRAVKFFTEVVNKMLNPLSLSHDSDIEKLNNDAKVLTLKLRCNEFDNLNSVHEKLKDLIQ